MTPQQEIINRFRKFYLQNITEASEGESVLSKTDFESFLESELTTLIEKQRKEIEGLIGGLYYVCTYDGEHPYQREIEGFDSAVHQVLSLKSLQWNKTK